MDIDTQATIATTIFYLALCAIIIFGCMDYSDDKIDE